MKIRSLPALFGLAALAGLLPPARAAELPAAVAAEAKYLPDGCQFVGVVRVEQLLGSAAFQQLRGQSEAVRKLEKAVAAELPLRPDDLDRVVFGGEVTGEGLFVFRTRKPITVADVLWAHEKNNRPVRVVLEKHELYRRKGDAFSLVAPDLLLVGQEKLLTAVLARNKAPAFTGAIEEGLRDVGPKATAAFALDYGAVRAKRPRQPPAFVLGVDMQKIDDQLEGLAGSVQFGDAIDLGLTAWGRNAAAAGKLKREAEEFAKFLREAVKKDVPGATPDLLNLFNVTPAVKETRVSIATRCSPETAARLLAIRIPDSRR